MLGLNVSMNRRWEIQSVVVVLLLMGSSFIAGGLIGGNRAYENGYTAGGANNAQYHQAEQVSPTFTGMDVWNKLNQYRQAQGFKTLVLDDDLCNNIAGRTTGLDKELSEKGDWSHEGLRNFIDTQIEDGSWPEEYRYGVTELLAYGQQTADQVVKEWAGSPSHWKFITDTELAKGCVYAWEGKVLLFMR